MNKEIDEAINIAFNDLINDTLENEADDKVKGLNGANNGLTEASNVKIYYTKNNNQLQGVKQAIDKAIFERKPLLTITLQALEMYALLSNETDYYRKVGSRLLEVYGTGKENYDLNIFQDLEEENLDEIPF